MDNMSKRSDVMDRLACSQKLAKVTLDRAKARMPNSTFNNVVNFDDDMDSNESDCKTCDKDCDEVIEAVSSAQKVKSHVSPKRSQAEFSTNPVEIMQANACPRKSMDMLTYYMNRISFQCECYFNSLPIEAMSRDDKLHFQRFHTQQSRKKMATGGGTLRIF